MQATQTQSPHLAPAAVSAYPWFLIVSKPEAASLVDRVMNRIGGGAPNITTLIDPEPPHSVLVRLHRDAAGLLSEAERAQLRQIDEAHEILGRAVAFCASEG